MSSEKKHTKKPLTATNPMPKGLEEWLAIRMLGKPFAEFDAETRTIKRGYTFEGKKYYCGEGKCLQE